MVEKGLSDTEKSDMRKVIAEKYNWNKIAEQTIDVYKKALDPQITQIDADFKK